MLRETDRHFKFDWLTIILFFILVGFGWVNILSASHSGETINLLNFSNLKNLYQEKYKGKQL